MSVAACAAFSITACRTTSPHTPADIEERQATEARILSKTARRVAVSKVGAKVCRSLTVGISERDWIRGIVIETIAEKVRVKIEDAGRFRHTVNEIAVVAGALVLDDPLNWTPCV